MTQVFSGWDLIKNIPIALAFLLVAMAGWDVGQRIYDHLWPKKKRDVNEKN